MSALIRSKKSYASICGRGRYSINVGEVCSSDVEETGSDVSTLINKYAYTRPTFSDRPPQSRNRLSAVL